MRDNQKKYFTDCLDTVFVIKQDARKNLGEDSFYCVKSKNSALISVFDGCGGLGARKYDTFQGHTGAYMASRIISGATCEWYHNNYTKEWKDAPRLIASLDQYIRKAYGICEKYTEDARKIKGSMVRKFPTTMAMAYAQLEQEKLMVHILWAGDSRIYLLDDSGLSQLSKDDTEVEDALENLISDGAMTNVLSADGRYKINSKTIYLTKPAIILAATDGCFGYIPSPMEFEYLLLNSLIHTATPEILKKELYKQFSQYAGDDFTFGMMSFFYGDYNSTRQSLKPRLDYLEQNYINVIMRERSQECLHYLWGKYKINYEKYIK